MFYIDFLQSLHEALSPRTYLEIGIRSGRSLSLSRCPSVGIDPDFEISHELQADVALEQCTSDAYFASLGDSRPFGELPIDLAFIDGLHLVEYVVRDFLNVERFSEWSTVVVVDDIYPRNVDEAARTRHTDAWTGDVFKFPYLLETQRKDLVLVRVDTQPTGLLLVFCPDPTRSRGPLLDALDAVMSSDPQEVSPDVFARNGALSADAALNLDIWGTLTRDRGAVGPEAGRALALRALGIGDESSRG
jgi:hypothetical protein